MLINAYMRAHHINNIYMYICYSYTMDTSGLPDMYTRSPGAESVHIRQTTSGRGITVMSHSHPLW